MKIIRIYPKTPPLTGGMEQHIRMLTQFQVDKGHKVQVVFNQGDKITSNDIQILPSIPMHRIRPQIIGFGMFLLSVVIHTFFKPLRADLIHIHGDWSSFIFAGILKRRIRAGKIIFSIHGSVDHYKGIRKLLLLNSVKKADMVFCTGHDTYQFIHHHTTAIFQPSGIRDTFFQDISVDKYPEFTITTVANLVKAKNLDTLLDIALQLPKFKFKIIGTGPMEEQLMQKKIDHKIRNLSFEGFLRDQQIVEQLSKSHLLLLTSVREGTPTAVMEAMACGLPVISSAAGGLEYIVENNINGFIIQDPYDTNNYVSQISLLHERKEIREKMALANKSKAEDLSWTKVAERINKLMTDV